MQELLVDFITTLDGYASGDGWPGFWGLEGPEYLAWLGEQPDVTYLMGANTYRVMSGFAAGEMPAGTDEFTADEQASVDGLTQASKVVFSSTLEDPLAWANSTLVREDAVEVVRAMKEDGSGLLSTIGSLSLCRSLLRAGLVDRFRVVMFPVITGATGSERIYDGYPDVALEMIDSRTFDGRTQLVEYRPRVLERPPLDTIDLIVVQASGVSASGTPPVTSRPRRTSAARTFALMTSSAARSGIHGVAVLQRSMHDRHRDPGRMPLDQRDAARGGDDARREDPQVPADQAFVPDDRPRGLPPDPDPELEARSTRRGDLDDGVAPLPRVTDADVCFDARHGG